GRRATRRRRRPAAGRHHGARGAPLPGPGAGHVAAARPRQWHAPCCGGGADEGTMEEKHMRNAETAQGRTPGRSATMELEPATMMALVYHGPGKRSWEEKPRPRLLAPTDA